MTQIQQVHALFSYFDNCHKRVHGKPAQYNRVKRRWDMKIMLEDLGMANCKIVIDYFFSLSKPRHDLQTLLYNYTELLEAKERRDSDRQLRQKLKQETKLRVEKLRKEQDELGSKAN